MPFGDRIQCFICEDFFVRRAMVRISGIDNVFKREIAVQRRFNFGRRHLDIEEQTRICNNCNISIVEEMQVIENDPSCLRLNVLRQTSSISCLICNAENEVHRLSIESRVDIFVKKNILIQKGTRSCQRHLDDNGYITDVFQNGLQFVNRPYVFKGTELSNFLQALRKDINLQKSHKYESEQDFTDEQFAIVSPISKAQFNDLFSFCYPVLENQTIRSIHKKDLLTFLCKMHQGISDSFLQVLFNYSSRQLVSSIISLVRKSLMQAFVPQNIGFQSITRNEYIERHVTDFANILYNNNMDERFAIVCNDCTYLDIEKSSCFKVLRQSFCVHKGKHLIKPSMFVAPDGYILNITGPYFSNSRNNDANILKQELQRDVERMREWFQAGDIFVVDRGYRDAIPLLQRLGIEIRMPSVVLRERNQLTTVEANASRLVTKNRWVVEARNGHLKTLFKFLSGKVIYHHVPHIRDFLLICGGIINKYHQLLEMPDATVEIAIEMLQKAEEPNVVQARVELDNLRMRHGDWIPLNENHVPEFPRMTIDELKKFTYGSYQIYLSPSYVQDNFLEDRQAEFQIDRAHEPGFLRIRIFSRFRNETRHQVWIAFLDENEVDYNNEEKIQGYYCTCKSGARTLGACVHVASIVWYLSNARYGEVKYPSTKLLNVITNIEVDPLPDLIDI